MGYAMAAAKPGGSEVLHKITLGDLTPAAGEVLIKHDAVGINFLDIYIRNGAYPWPVDGDLILGSEGAGIIEAVGSDVKGLAVGDRVGYTLANGAYATHRVIDAAYVVKLPDNVPSNLAASIMLKGLTVAYLIHDSYAVKPGDTVLFHAAAGGVGLIAGQWLKALGATTIGTAGGAEKCALAKANGFDHVIDYTSTDFEAEVMRLTNGEGVTVAYDSVGNDTMARTITSTKRRGTIIAFGQSSGPYADFKISGEIQVVEVVSPAQLEVSQLLVVVVHFNIIIHCVPGHIRVIEARLPLGELRCPEVHHEGLRLRNKFDSRVELAVRSHFAAINGPSNVVRSPLNHVDVPVGGRVEAIYVSVRLTAPCTVSINDIGTHGVLLH